MKEQAMAVLVLAREKAKATKAKPKVVTAQFATPVAKDDGREAWMRFKSECVLLTRKEK